MEIEIKKPVNEFITLKLNYTDIIETSTEESQVTLKYPLSQLISNSDLKELMPDNVNIPTISEKGQYYLIKITFERLRDAESFENLVKGRVEDEDTTDLCSKAAQRASIASTLQKTPTQLQREAIRKKKEEEAESISDPSQTYSSVHKEANVEAQQELDAAETDEEDQQEFKITPARRSKRIAKSTKSKKKVEKEPNITKKTKSRRVAQPVSSTKSNLSRVKKERESDEENLSVASTASTSHHYGKKAVPKTLREELNEFSVLAQTSPIKHVQSKYQYDEYSDENDDEDFGRVSLVHLLLQKCFEEFEVERTL